MISIRHVYHLDKKFATSQIFAPRQKQDSVFDNGRDILEFVLKIPSGIKIFHVLLMTSLQLTVFGIFLAKTSSDVVFGLEKNFVTFSSSLFLSLSL